MSDNAAMSLKRHLSGYAIVGLLQWLIEYAVMLALSQWLLPVPAANICGRICGALLGFWLNGRWTFAGEHSALSRKAMLRFALVWLGLTLLNTAIVSAIDLAAGLRAAQVLKPVIDLGSAGIGFLLSRHWIYSR